MNSPGGCWLQIRYTLDSERLATNVNETIRLARLSTAEEIPVETALKVLSNLTTNADPRRKLTGYALTSANDAPGRDPGSWELLGSNDGGKTWSGVDSRTNQVFSDRFTRRVFKLGSPAAFCLYRLRIDRCFALNSICQIGEIEPLIRTPKMTPVIRS